MLVAFAILAVAKAQTQPTFPNDWSSDEVSNNVIWQGDYVYDDNNNLCCGEDSNCQIQTGYQKGTRYFAYTQRKSRFDDMVANQIVIEDYKLQVEVAVDANMNCTAWCPMVGSMEPFNPLDQDSVNLGPVTINGKTLQHWQYLEKGPLNVTMGTYNTFIDQTDPNNPIPVLENDLLTPFKINLGVQNETWSNWKPGAQDPSLFAYTNGPAAGCPKASNCGNSDHLLQRYRRGHRKYTLAQIFAQRQEEELAKTRTGLEGGARRMSPGIQAATTPGAAPPTFPIDFTTVETDFLVLPQGDYITEESGGMNYWCLSTESNGKIQTEYQAGHSWVSGSTNQTRFGGDLGQNAVVSDYNLMKEFAVDGNNSCTSYCPLTTSLYNLVIDPKAKDLGKTILPDGNAYEHWQWSDKILRVVVMDTVDAFVDMSSGTPVPYLWMESITPFNQYLASANTTYTDFVGGKQAANLFAVTGIQGCPINQNCQQTSDMEN